MTSERARASLGGSPSSPPRDAGAQELVGGRYRLEQRLGEGGMGAVFRAQDLVAGKAVALKRLLGGERARLRMFEREYHALSGIRHPRIIEVYDYGVDASGAYYTMELLDGRDLRELAPLPYVEACQYLRDVACSLSLLHARRLLHRDLSARNVRVTADGHAKLLDFGALTSFGRSAQVVGTPPALPPEALYGGELDQRADLYSLGTLLYWTLTGRQAYRVKSLEELPSAWAKSFRPPSELARARDMPELPPELDELVAALLSPNPLARPASAVEVIGRLSSIANLPPESEPLSPASYLQGGHTVGRSRERAQLRKRLKAALAGRGSCVLLSAGQGMGSTRILSELAVEARLSGAIAVVVDARQHRGTYGVTEQVARALLSAEPERARRAMGAHESALLRFLPASAGRISTRLHGISDRPPGDDDPRAQRLRTQAALQAWFEALLPQRPLFLAVTGLQHVDDASAAWLAGLARAARDRPLLLAGSLDPQAPVRAPALATLRADAVEIELHALSQGDVHALVEATFGQVDDTERLASWLHQLTAGNPQQCLDLMRSLVERQVIRFQDGVWVLPLTLSEHELPSDVEQAMRERLARLTPRARRLAQALSVHLGPIPRARLLAIAERESIAEPLAALSELELHGVLVSDDEHTRFAHELALGGVQSTLDEPEQRRLHALVGALLEREQDDDPLARLDAGYHLLHGGDESRGADRLAEVGIALCFDGDHLPAAVPALRAALEVYRRQGRSAREVARVLGPLAIAGFYHDLEVLETYGEPASEALAEVAGVALGRQLQRVLGPRLGLFLGLGVGFVRTAFAVGPLRARQAFIELMGLYSTVATVLVGLGALTLDTERTPKYAALLEPFALFGRNHGLRWIAELAATLALVPQERYVDAIAKARVVLARVDDPEPLRGMSPGQRRLITMGTLYVLGGMLGVTEKPEALQIADRLEGMDWLLEKMFASQIRAAYHSTRGEALLGDRYRDDVERMAMLAGSGWQAEVWSACNMIQASLLSGDVLAVKRTAAQLGRIARSLPALQRHAQLAEASSLMHDGQWARSFAIGAPTIEGIPVRGFVGWAGAMCGHIRNLAMQGQAELALERGKAALALYDAEDRKLAPFMVALIAEVALIEAGLGQHAEGARRIDAYLEEVGSTAGPATLCTLLEARARVALLAADLPAARLFGSRMQQVSEPTDNPALIARCERLKRALDSEDDDARELRVSFDFGEPLALRSVQTVTHASSRKDRFERALELILAQSGGARGQLYENCDGELMLRAGEDDAQARAQALAALTQADRAEEATVASKSLGSRTAPAEPVSSACEVVLLTSKARAGERVVAVVCIALGARAFREPSRALLAALGSALAEPDSAELDVAPSQPPPSQPPP